METRIKNNFKFIVVISAKLFDKHPVSPFPHLHSHSLRGHIKIKYTPSKVLVWTLHPLCPQTMWNLSSQLYVPQSLHNISHKYVGKDSGNVQLLVF